MDHKARTGGHESVICALKEGVNYVPRERWVCLLFWMSGELVLVVLLLSPLECCCTPEEWIQG